MAKPLVYAARLQKEPFNLTEDQKKASKERYTDAKRKARLKKA